MLYVDDDNADDGIAFHFLSTYIQCINGVFDYIA